VRSWATGLPVRHYEAFRLPVKRCTVLQCERRHGLGGPAARRHRAVLTHAVSGEILLDGRGVWEKHSHAVLRLSRAGLDPKMIRRRREGMNNPISRRKLLARVMQMTVGGALVSSAYAADTECVDLKKMSSSEVSSRNSLHWTAKSTMAGKSCDKCNFFSATTGGCGMCVILGGATYATGYCDSWTAKDS